VLEGAGNRNLRPPLQLNSSLQIHPNSHGRASHLGYKFPNASIDHSRQAEIKKPRHIRLSTSVNRCWNGPMRSIGCNPDKTKAPNRSDNARDAIRNTQLSVHSILLVICAGKSERRIATETV